MSRFGYQGAQLRGELPVPALGWPLRTEIVNQIIASAMNRANGNPSALSDDDVREIISVLVPSHLHRTVRRLHTSKCRNEKTLDPAFVPLLSFLILSLDTFDSIAPPYYLYIYIFIHKY